MMLQRELCELKIEELFKENQKLVDDFKTGKCDAVYCLEYSSKICEEIRGIAYALGYAVESKIGRKE